MKKLISALIAVSLGATMIIPWTASAALRTIGDDFTGYTADDDGFVDTIPATTSEQGAWCTEGAETLIAENADVQWYTSKKFRKSAQVGEVYNYGRKPMVLVDTDKDRFILLDGARAIMKPKAGFTLGDKTIIKFDTYTASGNSGDIGGSTAGVDLFSDANEENYIKFYHAGHEANPIGANVQLFQNGTRNAGISVNHLETFANCWNTSGGKREWEITIEGKKLSYSVKRAGAVVFTGSVTDTYGLIDNYTNLLSVSGGGQGKWTAVGNISITTGEYYEGGMGEPAEVVYRNLIEGKTAANEIEFTPAAVRRIEAPMYADAMFQLSEDGTSYTNVILDSSGSWINTQNNTEYKYIKAPGEIDPANVKILTDVEDNSSIQIGRGNQIKFYYTTEGTIQQTAGFASSEAAYATVADDGTVTAVKGGSSDITVGGRKFTVVVKSALELAEDAAAGGDTSAIPNYVASQQTLVDQKVNDNITAYQNETDKTSAVAVQARTDVENFFFTETAGSFTDMDVVTTTRLASMTAREKGVFIDNVLALTTPYSVGTTIDSVRGFETEILEACDVACEKAQLDIIALLNADIAAGNTSDVNDFFFAGAVDGLGDIGVIATDVSAEITDPLAQGRFVEKIKTYTFDCVQAADILKMEEILKKEIRVTAVDNLTATDDVKAALLAGNNCFAFPLTSEYFTSNIGNIDVNILTRLSNVQFVNFADLKTRFYEALVMENVKTSMSEPYITGLVEQFAAEIGYNVTHYNSVKSDVIAAIVNNKATFTDIASVRNYIDNYVVQAAPQGGLAGGNVVGGGNGGGGAYGGGGNNGNVYGSGNGGSGVGMGSTIVPAVTQTPAENAAVDKVQLFGDVATDVWYYEATRFLKANGAISGYENGDFMPNNGIIRAEFMSILMKAFKIELPEATEGEEAEEEVLFSDISKDEWYFECMNNGGKLGIISGFDGKCNPKDNISRQEMAAFIMRAVEYKGAVLTQVNELIPYADESDIADWALSAIYKLTTAGVLNGNDGNALPNANATRAEAAQIIYKACEAMKVQQETAE